MFQCLNTKCKLKIFKSVKNQYFEFMIDKYLVRKVMVPGLKRVSIYEGLDFKKFLFKIDEDIKFDFSSIEALNNQINMMLAFS